MARTSRKHLESTAPAVREPERVFYNAGAYVRLSSDDTKKRGDSLETQRNIIENYIAAESDIRTVEVYTDNNATGTNFDRPGFQRMLADAHSGKINCIIVKDLTRFGRNAIDSGYYIEKVLPSIGVRFIAVTDSFDSATDNGGILVPIKNIISESYALDIGRKCRAVQRQNINDGRFIGRLAPYGFKKSPDDCHKLTPDEETAPIVRRIFEWAAEGVGSNEIARRLGAEGIPSPSHRNYEKGYNKSEKLLGTVYWKKNAINKMLADPVYIGDMLQGKTRSMNNKREIVDPAEWVCVPNTHEPLVSREIFDRVQVLREAAYEKASAVQTKPYTPHVLKGKVFCAHCGYPMHRHKQSKHEYYWYRCESQWQYGKDTCVQVSVKESEILAAILETLCGQADAINADAKDAAAIIGDADETELRDINQKLAKNGRYLKSLYENLAGGLITTAEYTQMKADYGAKIEVLSIRADEIRASRRDAETRNARSVELSHAVSAAVQGGALTAEIADSLVDKVLVRQDKSFHVEYSIELGEVPR